MSEDVYQSPTTGPQGTYFKNADIKQHSDSISAKKVYSSKNITVSLSGQVTFGGTPMMAGLVLPNPTYLSVNIPFKNN
ncbi:MAG: hypothetical protein ACI837_000795 [Crocinitomicaceae bacterium]|jgi:hypothetical protein